MLAGAILYSMMIDLGWSLFVFGPMTDLYLCSSLDYPSAFWLVGLPLDLDLNA